MLRVFEPLATAALNSGVLNAAACNVNGCDPQLTAPAVLDAGTWHHVAYTFDGTAQQQVLYLDGGQVASSATTLAAGYDTQSLYLGRDTENGAPNYSCKAASTRPPSTTGP